MRCPSGQEPGVAVGDSSFHHGDLWAHVPYSRPKAVYKWEGEEKGKKKRKREKREKKERKEERKERERKGEGKRSVRATKSSKKTASNFSFQPWTNRITTIT